MQEFFGIDFGTTNSAVVGKLRRNITKYGDSEGQPFPSLVAVNATTGQVAAIGRDVWRDRQQLSESCRIFASAKMQLGEGKSEMIGPERWTYERVVTEIFLALKQRISERGRGAKLEETVVAIPVGFAPAKRKALRKAASDAGVQIRGFVSEPTAAVFRSLHEVRHWPYVAVFDWGGGTLDISVVQIQGDVVHEIATVPKELGGDVLDRLLADWAHTQILLQKGAGDKPFSAMESRYRDRLISQCEIAKRDFSEHSESTISLQKYGDYGAVNLTITLKQFEALMQHKIDEALATLEEGVIHRARLSFDQVHILLVGGSSKLRGLRDAMARREWQFSLPEDSDWHVADGAASLASNFGKFISAQNLGLRLSDDTVFHLVTKGKRLDSVFGNMTFGLVEDANHARLIFVETLGDTARQAVAAQRCLDYISVPAFGFPNEPIEINWNIDRDLILNVVGQSGRKGERTESSWSYEELRFSYELPRNDQ